jgi:hypothetical protein
MMSQWLVKVSGFTGLMGICMTLLDGEKQRHKDAVGWKGSSFFSVKRCKGDVKEGLGAL